ncbi:MAG TPA: hypothetical protein ENJ56_05615, partial [Anaerolineae bacterium]|nr:hypothetical protein [Anaerolineae bacterium]
GWGAPPAVGWPPPSDFFAAEEAFSVYDHPPVWIFRKTAAFDTETARAILAQADLDNFVFMNPGQATKVPTNLMLDSAEFARQQANGTFKDIFHPDSLLNQHPFLAAAAWYAMSVLLGLLTFPISFKLFKNLPSRGYAISRILALLLISYIVWITASLGWLPNTRSTHLIAILLLAGLSAVVLLSTKGQLFTWLRENNRFILIVELISLSLFLLSLLIRYRNPDVWHVIWGGEKPMDLTYFTATLKSVSFPPYDPWYAGGQLNYYYYGFVFVGVLTKLLGIVPTLAYNLAIPTLLSLTGLGAFSAAFDLTQWREKVLGTGRKTATPPKPISLVPSTPATDPSTETAKMVEVSGNVIPDTQPIPAAQGMVAEVSGNVIPDTQSKSDAVDGLLTDPPTSIKKGVIAGLFAILLSVLLGNLAQLKTIAAYFSTDFFYPGNWFWTASRAISVPEGQVQPITEFPFFTFLYGDLHAHMIALPLTMLALTWVINLALQPHNKWRGQESGHSLNLSPYSGDKISRYLPNVAMWLLGGLTIGVLYPTNSWDWPTYIVLGMLAILLSNLRKHKTLNLRLITQLILQTALLVTLSYLLFLPFRQTFGAGFTEIGLWKEAKTGLISYLAVYGLFIFLAAIALAHALRSSFAALSLQTREQMEWLTIPLLLAAAGLLFSLTAALYLGYQVALIALPFIVVATILALNPQLPANQRVVLGLIAAGFGLTLLVEIVVIKGTVGRMNTVFKFYMQVWMLLSVVGGIAFSNAVESANQWGRIRRTTFIALLSILVFIAALYPFTATRAKWQIRMSEAAPHTLDGMAFMQTASYDDQNYNGQSQRVSLAGDYDAIRWIQRNIAGSPTFAEAYSDNFYRSISNRVAMYTGNPDIVGWNTHQSQQRAAAPDAQVRQRIDAVHLLYNTTDTAQALDILQKYGVDYIYVGELERVYYSAEGLAKFEQMVKANLLQTVYRQNGVTIYAVVGQQPE